MLDRDSTIKTLREMAAWLEARSDLPTGEAYFAISVGLHGEVTRPMYAAWLKAFGTAKKNATQGLSWIEKEFGCPSATLTVHSYNVCRKIKVTKTLPAQPAVAALPERIVEVEEWDCSEPVLASLPEDAAQAYDRQPKEEEAEEASIGKNLDVRA